MEKKISILDSLPEMGRLPEMKHFGTQVDLVGGHWCGCLIAVDPKRDFDAGPLFDLAWLRGP